MTGFLKNIKAREILFNDTTTTCIWHAINLEPGFQYAFWSFQCKLNVVPPNGYLVHNKLFNNFDMP